jgi:hypothetical protein
VTFQKSEEGGGFFISLTTETNNEKKLFKHFGKTFKKNNNFVPGLAIEVRW